MKFKGEIVKKEIKCSKCGRKLEVDVEPGEKADIICKCGYMLSAP